MVGVRQQSQSLNDRHPGGRISHLLVDVHLSGRSVEKKSASVRSADISDAENRTNLGPRRVDGPEVAVDVGSR